MDKKKTERRNTKYTTQVKHIFRVLFRTPFFSLSRILPVFSERYAYMQAHHSNCIYLIRLFFRCMLLR